MIFCFHSWSWPITLHEAKRTYQTCVKCGAERDYDWGRMAPAHVEPEARGWWLSLLWWAK
jgi:hypothetical protein